MGLHLQSRECDKHGDANTSLTEVSSDATDEIAGTLSCGRQAFFEEICMFKVQAPVIIVTTPEAREAIGARLGYAGQAAYREIAMAAKGLEIAHLQFAFRELTLAVCSRVRRDGVVEVEIGLGNPRLPASLFTSKQLRDADAAAWAKARGARGPRRPGMR